MDYTEFRLLLDIHIHSILNLLPLEFTSNGFIKAMIDVINDNYARALTTAGQNSYRLLHTWIARWYLQGLAERGIIEKTNRATNIKTRNGFVSQNNIWRKL